MYIHAKNPIRTNVLITKNKNCHNDNKNSDIYQSSQLVYPDSTCLKAYYLTNNSKTSFTGFQAIEKVRNPDSVNKTGTYQCDTNFFRDLDTLEVMKKYLKKNFPKGTHIADFGCSNGEEARTIAMMLSDINEHNKYTITGYDPVEDRIDEANRGRYFIGMNVDGFLGKEMSELTPSGQKLKKIFDYHFKNESHYDTRHEYCFKANDDKFSCINFFDIGNINNVDKILQDEKLKDKKTGIIIFKNAWYHITQSNPGNFSTPNEYDDLSDLKKVLSKIHKVLPENGILVTGSLPRDHILGGYAFDEGVINESPFHKALKDSGFVPVEESAVKVQPMKGPMDFWLYKDAKVYSIWKKCQKPSLWSKLKERIL